MVTEGKSGSDRILVVKGPYGLLSFFFVSSFCFYFFYFCVLLAAVAFVETIPRQAAERHQEAVCQETETEAEASLSRWTRDGKST